MVLGGEMGSVPMIAGGVFDLDGMLPTKGDIDRGTEELQSRISALALEIHNSDVAASSPQLQTFLDQWNKFVDDWEEWKGFFSWFFSTYRTRRDELLAFRTRYNALYSTFESVGGVPVTETSKPYEADQVAPVGSAPSTKPSGLETSVKWIATGAIVIAGAYALGKVAGVVGPLRAPAREVF